jgi:hypothetical protein
LNAVILKAMEKAPSRRYPGAADFRAAILLAAPAQKIVRKGDSQQRGGFLWRCAAGIAIVGLGMGAAFMAGGYWNSRPSSPASAPTAQAVPEAAKGTPNVQARAKKAPRGSTAPAARSKPPLPSFANVEGRYVIGQSGETKPPQPAVVEAPVASAPPGVPAGAEAGAKSPETSKPETTDTEPKKHNVVVRALGKIFHKKGQAPETTSDIKGQKPAAKSAKSAWDW